MVKNSELFQVPAAIVKLETMSDGGIRVVIDTQELTDPQELTKLFELRKGAVGWFLFKATQVELDEVPDESVEEGEHKSPSQRLRAVLFVYWKEVKGGKGDFNLWYRAMIEKIIEEYKAKLPPKSEE